VKKIRGESDLWRIRVGDHRLIYRVHDRDHAVDITHIRHRRDAYA